MPLFADKGDIADDENKDPEKNYQKGHKLACFY